MNKYYGYFDVLQEQGSGTSYYFREENSKYLSGYEQLELAYFFKIHDAFTIVVAGKDKTVEYSGLLTFKYDNKIQCLVPNEIDLGLFKKWISENKTIYLESEKNLFSPYFVLRGQGLGSDVLKEEIQRLLVSNNVPEKFLKVQKDLKELQFCFKFLYPPTENFFDFLVKEQDFLFGESPVDILLTNRAEHLIKWFKDRM